ncbi:hypothetical protein, partial [Citrobacter amalonaticus]|uniref:hypothetical protein n=1 Tax=Citrobacter amalonaticus TaxID=35703 RepID=UPI0019031EC2
SGRGGWKWPNGIGNASCNAGSRDVIFHFDYCPPALSETLISPHDFDAFDIVTREQYEAALAASKTEWNGEGLPPVGCECQYETNGYGIKKVRVECITKDGIAFTWLGEDPRFRGLDCINTSQSHRFRPIRSEVDKKKEEAIKAIFDTLAQYDNLKGCHTLRERLIICFQP